MTNAEAGRLGGLQTFLRHGREEMSRRGKLGGRPRLPTLEELESQEAARLARAQNRRRGIGRPFWSLVKNGYKNMGVEFLRAIVRTFPELCPEVIEFLKDGSR